MKNQRCGQAKVLEEREIDRLSDWLQANSPKHWTVFMICLYSGLRVAEACSLRASDIYGPSGAVHAEITARKETTKGRKGTRQIPVNRSLRTCLVAYWQALPGLQAALLGCQAREAAKRFDEWALFPGAFFGRPMATQAFDEKLRSACKALGLRGVSTHSMRRTFITRLSQGQVPLPVIAEMSGHSSMDVLRRYVEVSEMDKRRAVAVLD